MNVNSPVFLCHNSKDKDFVRRLKQELFDRQVETWIDEKNLLRGSDWHSELEAEITSTEVVVVCIGPHGLGPWQKSEVAIFNSRKHDEADSIRIIPMILPDCTEDVKLPPFLGLNQDIDFRRQSPDPMDELVTTLNGDASVSRPTVTIMYRPGSAYAENALHDIRRYLVNSMVRVRTVSTDAINLDSALKESLDDCDLLLMLLSEQSFSEHSGFPPNVEHWAQSVARKAGTDTLRWRSADMPLPADSKVARQFRHSQILTDDLPNLCQHVFKQTSERFELRTSEIDAATTTDSQRRMLVSCPDKLASTATTIHTFFQSETSIRCAVPPRLTLAVNELLESRQPYDAFVIVMAADNQWLDDVWCEVKRLEEETRGRLRIQLGAYFHDEEQEKAPFVDHGLEQFDHYVGQHGLRELRNKVLALEANS